MRIAAAVAGSTLIVSAAAPAVASWPRLPWQHPGDQDQGRALSALDAGTGAAAGAGLPAQGSTAYTRSQWSQIPAARVAAARVAAAKVAAARKAAAERAAAERAATRRAAAQRAAAQRAAAHRAAHRHQAQQAAQAAAYANPFRSVSGLVPERVDMGVDFGGAGPVYALGNGVVISATSESSGWPGGGWITYRLTSGPAAGLVVYVAEDVTPTVQAGQTVSSSTVIANMFNGGDGIETGWATPDGSTAESQLAEAGGISGGGPFPTMVGLNFEALLEAVGVPAGPNASQPGNGALPPNYPASWAGV